MNGKSRAWALALLVAVFLVGGAAGAGVDRMLVAAELALSDEQRTQVQTILERSRDQASALWREYRPRYEEMQGQARAEIRGLLSEEQAAAYDALLEKQRRRRERAQDGGRDNN
jgi:hypothetical protein